jgi:malate/lactate dehydrogenase
MLRIAIVGAGELGGLLAHSMANLDIAATIHLIDRAGQIAAGKALDIQQASAIQPFATRVIGSNDLFAAGGADVVMVADRGDQNGAEWTGDEGVELIAELDRLAPRAVFVCAGADQRQLVERGVREQAIATPRLIGSAPEALVSALRALVALEADTAASAVSLTVLGVPPQSAVVPWEQATIAGLALTGVLEEPAIRRLAARVGPLWPPGPQALAGAAAQTAACIAGVRRQAVCSFVVRELAGASRRAVALPVRLGRGGVTRPQLPALSPGDRVAFDNAVADD